MEVGAKDMGPKIAQHHDHDTGWDRDPPGADHGTPVAEPDVLDRHIGPLLVGDESGFKLF